MRMVVQRVTRASVEVDGVITGQIGKGFLVLCGISQDDTVEIADRMVKKLCGLRIFDDEQGKTNLSLTDVGGRLLIISQFTLYADSRKGYRPSFINAGRPEMAEPLYEHILEEAGKYIPDIQHGIFGAEMHVDLMNDGPFTIILDSAELF